MIPAVLFLAAYHYGREALNVKKLLVPLFCVLVSLVFLVVPVMNIYREYYFLPIGSDMLMTERVQRSYLAVKRSSHTSADVISSLEEVIERFEGIIPFSVIVSQTQAGGRLDFEHGRTFLLLPSAFIPRFVWPEKPRISLGRMIRLEYYGWGEGTRGEHAVTHIGELYLNFGLPGIAFGMLILGIIYRLTYLYFIKLRKVTEMSILVYIFTLHGLTQIEGSIGFVYSNIVFQLILLWLVNWSLSAHGGKPAA
jgi:hypothetical protein